MSRKADRLRAEALELPADERARLAQALIASLDGESAIDGATASEIQSRIDDLRAARVELTDADEVFAKLLEHFGYRA